MEIHIDPVAGEYILKKDKNPVVTVAIGERPQACCVKSALYPAVRLGKPDSQQMANYRQVTIDGIEVYYLDRLPQSFPRIKITIEKLLFFRKLVVVEE